MTRPRILAAATAITSAMVLNGAAFAQSGEVNVYSYRENKLVQPLIDAFAKDTGIKVNIVSASSGLEQRIKSEGANSPADVLLTVDIGRIDEAVKADVTQPIKSDVIDKVVPAQYRDPNGHWTGIVRRSRLGLVAVGGGDLDGDLLGVTLPRRSPVAARPGLMWAADMDVSEATSASLVGVAAFGAASASSYAWSGLIDWPVAGLLVAGGLVGALVGSRANAALSHDKALLGRIFAGFVIVAGLYVAGRGALTLFA